MTAVRRALVAGAAAAVLALAPAAPGVAQVAAGCPAEPDVDAQLAAAPIAFTGIVSEVRDGGREAYVRVFEQWKGPRVPRDVLVRGTVAEQAKVVTALDRQYRQGANYLFMPTRGVAPRFSEDACSGTVLLNTEIAAKAPPTRTTDLLREGGVTPPGEGRGRYAPLAIALVAFLGLGTGLALARRRGKALGAR